MTGPCALMYSAHPGSLIPHIILSMGSLHVLTEAMALTSGMQDRISSQ